jgi:transglutaminase-like putative cysteine protease
VKHEGFEIYLRPTDTIDADNEFIRETARRLTSGLSDDNQRAVKLYYFTRDNIHYNVYMISTYREDFRASTILTRGRGYCVQKSILLAALARALGIPSRLAFAKIQNHLVPEELKAQTGTNVLPAHGYAQLYLQDRWVSLSPAFDRELCAGNGLPPVEFDGETNATMPATDLQGRPFIDYIEKYEPQADLPFEWLRSRVLTIWGDKHAWLTGEASQGHRMPSGYVF